MNFNQIPYLLYMENLVFEYFPVSSVPYLPNNKTRKQFPSPLQNIIFKDLVRPISYCQVWMSLVSRTLLEFCCFFIPKEGSHRVFIEKMIDCFSIIFVVATSQWPYHLTALKIVPGKDTPFEKYRAKGLHLGPPSPTPKFPPLPLLLHCMIFVQQSYRLFDVEVSRIGIAPYDLV